MAVHAMDRWLRGACALAALGACVQAGAQPAPAAAPAAPAPLTQEAPPQLKPAALPGSAAPAAVDPNAIRVLLAPELETALVSQMVGRISLSH